ncbi:MAG: hypothetical protein JST43_03615 [Bacteroidetes bacterium]|nr:hypothetical protein [Bacteroidota bacterium]MBS1540185.1 hypothetical protein [Bacteroidota bacterium]
MRTQPNINGRLLWEYNLDTFNYDKSYKIVIERVLQLGTIEEWKAILNYYGEQKILETIHWSAQLRPHEKEFSMLFLKSDFLHAA